MGASENIDHAARDGNEIVAQMLARLRTLLPAWSPLSDADLGLTLVELLADRTDRLSYEQDAVGTESYIRTARRRSSVIRHARLLGVPAREACNARSWVHIELQPSTTVTVPGGTRLLTALDDVDSRVEPDVADGLITQRSPIVFETMHDIQLNAEHNRIPIHRDRNGAELARGATAAILCGHIDLREGDAVCFGPSTDSRDSNGHVVRLVASPVHDVDKDTGHPITVVRWGLADRLLTPILVSGADRGHQCRTDVVMRGNLVLADHGHTQTAAPLSSLPRQRWRLDDPQVTWSAPLSSGEPSAQRWLDQDPTETLPDVILTDLSTPGQTNWYPARDLLGVHRFARRFVIDDVDESHAEVRFSNGDHRRIPRPDAHLIPTLRRGSGPPGNVAAGSIQHIVSADPVIVGVTNVVAGTGGRRAESIDQLRSRAPRNWRQIETCVTPADYAHSACREPEVREAVGRWGEPINGFSVVELHILVDNESHADQILHEVRDRLEPLRIVGHVLQVLPAVRVALAVELSLTIESEQDRREVEAAVRVTLARSKLARVEQASLGGRVFTSEIVAAVISVAGVLDVDHVTVVRLDASDSEPMQPREVRIKPWEYAVLDPTAADSLRFKSDVQATT